MAPHRVLLAMALVGCCTLGCRSNPDPQPRPIAAVAPQDSFWASLQALCGRAFSGQMTEGSPSDSAFRSAELTMQVRACTPTEVRIPFHVGFRAEFDLRRPVAAPPAPWGSEP